jgi:translation elongation factor EF-1alpha
MTKEKQIGKVSHWYDKINVAVVKLTGALKKGDSVKFKHGEEEFEENIESLQIDHAEVKAGKKGDELAVKLSHKAKEGSMVYKVE